MKHTDIRHKCKVLQTYDLKSKKYAWSVGCWGCSSNGDEMGEVASFVYTQEGWKMAVSVAKSHAWKSYL